MKSLFFKLTTITALSLLISCNNENPDAVAPEEIGLNIQQEDVFAGSLQIEQHNLEYSVENTEMNVYKTTVSIDEKTLTANISYLDQHIDFNTENVSLTEEDTDILLQLGEEISQYIFQEKTTDNFTMAEYTLLTMLEYWGKAPEGYVHHKRSTTPLISESELAEKTVGVDEGITCIRKNTYVNAEYDDEDGNDVSESILVNGSNCIGRCGSGCGSWFSLASAWTKDCLDHDRCGRVLGGSTDPFDNNCGDEYSDAADDYAFGVIRGCSG